MSFRILRRRENINEEANGKDQNHTPTARDRGFVMFAALLWGTSLLPGAALRSLSFVATAYAYVGHPATPVSYAGVARRTTRRTVVATTPYR